MRYLPVLLVALLTGCAAPVFQVPLGSPQVDFRTTDRIITVKDGRLDKQIYMTGISFGSASHIYLLTAEPALEAALDAHVRDALREGTSLRAYRKLDLTIDELDIKNKVGFAKADQLSCRMESILSLHPTAGSERVLRVKSFSQNNENMSPLVVTSAKIILDQCLREHAADIARTIAATPDVARP